MLGYDKYRAALNTSAFKKKHDEALDVLHEFMRLASGRGYLALSGGKDSTVVAHLLSTISRDVPVFTQADDMDWPGKAEHAQHVAKLLGFTDHTIGWSTDSAAAEFGRAIAENYETAELHQTFRNAIAHYVTERGMQGVILGLRASESRARRLNIAKRGLLYRHADGHLIALPIGRWTTWEVLGYIAEHQLPIFHVYEGLGKFIGIENVRLCWPVYPKLIPKGGAALIKLAYPLYWHQLCQRFPELANTT